MIEPGHLDTVVVLGRGRLGKSLTAALRAAGIQVTNISARDRAGVSTALSRADIVFLAVPDEAIRETADALAQYDAERSTGFAHTSGALGLDELRPLHVRGNPVGSFHPFQPFSSQRPATAFRNSTIGIEACDEDMCRRLMRIATAIGATGRLVPVGDRALYHAAAVMASTYVVVLAAQAQSLLEAVGWESEEGLEALRPLMLGTLENLAANGIPGALSGPVRRGDVATIARHLNALEQLRGDSNVHETYRVLGRAAVQLARMTGLAPDVANRVTDLLARNPT